MGRSCFLKILLVSSLLVLFFSHGFGRKVMETVEHEDNSTVQGEETIGKSREIAEVMDYSDPGPNTNPKAGYILSPPPHA
ncbi:uncharacterized protein LOC111988955 [Quercus suber]|uniref:Uncharacterized protein n=1 Tax=Quercus suber TaxID=58331 RepID=A0AAW0IZ04_QUESU|nr:hypothetical protein CFP56_69893 [Quercus suber]POF20236.1 hypothetical protein CFP56_68897 [Quercus suber]POF20237.1 hypothetical protein CFP56_68898 [Quercus suber]